MNVSTAPIPCRLAFLLTLVASPALGATVHVANNGVDELKCGTAARPCRTIGRGLQAVPPGGVVEVGPGVYGDVDEDGAAAGGGEDETAVSPNTLLRLDQPVTVRSAAGPAATLIRCPANLAIAIEDAPATFGAKVNGFTLLGCTLRVAPGEGVAATVSGNRLIEVGPQGTGIELLDGRGVRITNNHCTGFAIGIDVAGTVDAAVTANVVSGNLTGIRDSAQGTLLSRNVVVGNGIAGLELAGGINDVTGAPVRVEANLVIGNAGSAHPSARGGILVEANPNGMTVNGNSIFGNTAPAENCGIFDLAGDDAATLDATGNFWGAASGPGPNPADLACSPLGTIDTSAFLTAPVKNKNKAMK